VIEQQSPYLKHQDRLADVIAAIQVMGTYAYSAREVEAWSTLLGDKPRSAESWLSIFKEHPEFFRAGVEDNGMHTLVLRRARPRLFDTSTGEDITKEEYKVLAKDERDKISRRPLNAEQVLSLIQVAVSLQNQAVTRRQELRWWVHVVISALTALVGAFVGASVAH